MGNIDSKKTYKAPQAKVVKVNMQGLLCYSGQNGQTPVFTVNGDNAIDEDAWE